MDAVAAASDAAAVCTLSELRSEDPSDLAEHVGLVLEGVAGSAAAAIARAGAPIDLLGLVQTERWPLTTPAPDAVLAAPAAVQVAWDAVWDPGAADHTMPALLEAHARAARLGLDWDDPVQRAVAERAVDEAAVAALLRAQAP
jgi:hypothetical protein